MKKIMLCSLAVSLTLMSFSQATINWGEEFKLRKGSTDLSVMHTDNTGVYVKESHMALKSYFVIAATTRESATLIKLDKNLTFQYDNNYNKELKGKEFDRFFFLKDKLFLFATDYNRKARSLSLHGVTIDKGSGELSGEWQEIAHWEKDEKGDDIEFNVTYNGDSTNLIVVSTVSGREKNTYQVSQFNDKLKEIGKPVTISNEFDPKTFRLEDVIYASNGNIVMVGRVFEYQEGKKKKSKFLDFKNYNIRVHGKTGAMLKEINTDIPAKWLVSTKVLQIPNKELVLAAFYSNEKKGREINGMLVQRLNPLTGEVISSNSKEINTSMITTLEDDTDDDGDDESRKERKEREKLEKIQNEEDGFSRYMRFRNFISTPDNGLIILAEKYHHYVYTTTTYRGGGMGGVGSTSTTTYLVYECGNLMMSKVDAQGGINWLHIVPKEQREVIQAGSSSGGTGFSVGFNYFENNSNYPFYAGFGTLPGNNTVNIIFNDHKKNDKVLQLGQKVKRIGYFRKSIGYAIKLDVLTGKYTRSELFNNNDNPTAMPRLGSVLGKDLYMVGKEDRLLGKSKIAIAKLSLKN